MLLSIVFAILVAVIVGLVCIFGGRMLQSAGNVPFLAAAGSFLEQYAWVIGLVAGLLYFLTNGSFHIK